MSKKKNKKVGTCLACAKRLKAKHVTCPRCGRPNSGHIGKGAGAVVVPFLGKSASIPRAAVPARLRAGRAGARCCTRLRGAAGPCWRGRRRASTKALEHGPGLLVLDAAGVRRTRIRARQTSRLVRGSPGDQRTRSAPEGAESA